MATPKYLSRPSPAIHLDEFQRYVEDHLRTGTDCDGNEATYIRHSALVNYWKSDQLTDIIQALHPERADLIDRRKLVDKHLRAFSILIYASTSEKYLFGEYLKLVQGRVTDDRLPSNEPRQYLSREAWKLFDRYQWMFFPVNLAPGDTQRNQIDWRSVLPGVLRTPKSLGRTERLSNGPNEARFSYLELDKDPTEVTRRGAFRMPDIVAIKSYPAVSRQTYSNESSFFSRSEQSGRRPKHVLRCLACYSCESPTRGESHNIVVEYGKKGSLLEYFENEGHPRTYADKKAFWTSLIPFLRGLEYLHQKDEGYGGSISVHHDVKPANMIVFPEEGSRFKFTIKVSDFGITKTKGKPAPLGPHQEGSSTYSAPEKCLAREVYYSAHPSGDLFGAGAVLLEAAAWVRGGRELRANFRQWRMNEIRKETSEEFWTGYGDCFHNGSIPLRCVKNISSLLDLDDPLTPSIIDVVLQEVFMKEEEQRMAAGRLRRRLEKILIEDDLSDSSLSRPLANRQKKLDTQTERHSTIEESPSSLHPSSSQRSNGRDGLRPSMDRSNDSSSPTPRPESPMPGPTLPHLTFEEVREWRRLGKDTPLKGRDVTFKLLKNRDHFLIVDNSITMQQYKAEILDKLPLLAYILKQVDPDGVEVILTHDCASKRYKTATDIEKYVRYHFEKGRESSCHMETCLQAIEEDICGRLPKNSESTRRRMAARYLNQPSGRVCIYFLTDGAWAEKYSGPDRDILETPLRRIANKLRDRGLDRYVSLQFIRLGNDPVGIQELDHLDKFLPREGDFVDHKGIAEAGVWHLLVGALMRGIDNDK